MKKFVKAVLITTILSVSTRALGLFIKIYISREIGATALGYYQIALSVFFLLCTLVTSGIPLVISRKIASNPTGKSKIVFSGLILSTIIGIAVCLFTIIFPKLFTNIWGQSNSLAVLFALLPAVLFTALYVPFRGAFWGQKNFFLLGFTELAEQIFRFIACFFFFSIISYTFSGEVVAGITYSVACVLSSALAIAIYFIKGNKILPSLKEIKPLISESLPIAVVRIVSSVITLLISIILPQSLSKTGIPLKEAIGEFGVVTGMVLPLLTIPGTLISSISVALTPEISGKDRSFTAKQINRSLSYSIIISFVLLPAFISLGKPIGEFLYNDTLSGELLKTGSILILPLGLSQISSSILNAIGEEKAGLISYLLGAAIMLVSVYFLPKFIGIYSLIVGMLGMSVITTLINLIVISNYLSSKPLKTFLTSFIFLIPSALIAKFSFNLSCLIFPTLISLIISGGLSMLMLVTLYQLFKFIDIKDFLPKKQKSHA